MRTTFIIFSLLLGFTVQAQIIHGTDGNKNARLAEIIPLDKSFLECIYICDIYDPVLDDSREYFKILEIGKSFSKFSNYGGYCVDSIIKSDYPHGITNNEYGLLDKRYRPTMEAIVRDFKTNTLRSYDKVFIDRYVYEEPIPEIKWNLKNESEMICGYKCHKATATFRGRNWTAWYCNIPQNNGPWKFGNLPGLILKVEDDKEEITFEAISIRKSSRKFGLKKIHYQKTTREKFNKTLSEYKTNPGLFLGSQFIATDRNGNPVSPVKRMFFNPIEKD